MENNTVISTEKKTGYSLRHSVYAWIMFAVGYLFIRWVFASELGLGAALFTELFVVFAGSWALVTRKQRDEKIRETFYSMLLLAVIAAFGSLFFTSANRTIKAMLLLYVLFMSLYWIKYTFEKSGKIFLGRYFALDMLKAMFVLPFGSFGAIFGALFKSTGKSKGGMRFLYIFIGLMITAIPSAVILTLLISGDSIFRNFISIFIKDFNEKIIENIIMIFFSIPVSMYLYGAFYSGDTDRYSNILPEESKKKAAESLRFIPPVVICTAQTPICLIYILFFLSQISRYLSAFAGVVPAGYTAADYAREGFFQLCAVTFINLVIIAVSDITAKKNDGKRSFVLRIYSVVLSLLTLLLITTAVRKMILYIELYGLTIKRVYTSWFMCFLAIMFIVIIVRQFTDKVNLPGLAVVIFTVFLAALAFSDIDVLIAEYNITAYQEGRLDDLDIQMFYDDLSDSVVPEVLELREDNGPEIREAAEKYLKTKTGEYNGTYDMTDTGYIIRSRRLKNINVPEIKAAALLEKAGYGDIDLLD